MNIIKHLVYRIEKRREETKSPCKSYSSYEAADKAASKMALEAAEHFSVPMVYYVVFYCEEWGRYCAAFDMTRILSTNGRAGGYLGIFSEKGFYSY